MTRNGVHSRPSANGSLRNENRCGESDSPTLVAPPGAEKTLRPSSASRPEVASPKGKMRSATASGGSTTS